MAKKLAKPTGAKAESVSTVMSKTDESELTEKREHARKLAKEKAQARTMARQQVIAEKLASAVEEMTSSLEQASGASEELGKTMQTVATAAEQASSAAEESRAAIGQITQSAEVSDERSKMALKKVKNLQDLIRSTAAGIDSLIRGVKNSANANVESTKLIRELEKNSEQIGEIVGAVVRIADCGSDQSSIIECGNRSSPRRRTWSGLCSGCG